MGKPSKLLLYLVLLLTVFGLVMLDSASPAQAEKMKHGSNYFLIHQCIFIGLSLLVGAGCAALDYRVWNKFAVPLTLFAIALLALLVGLHGAQKVLHIRTPLAHAVNGSWRWLILGPVNFQVSELIKFAILCWLARWMTHARRFAEEFRRGLLPALIGLIVVLGLVIAEPDYGTTALIAVVGFSLLLLGGSRFLHVFFIGSVGTMIFAFLIALSGNRTLRILAFLNPDEHKKDVAYQLIQALYAFVLGGPTGVGIGQSIQKQSYLPEAHTDFIFAIIGEEWGLVATLSLVLAFVLFFILGMRISFRAPDQFGRLLAFGLTLMITLQAAFNIAVVTGCLPTKGLALPFISYGGSSILLTYVMVGVLINIGRQAEAGPAAASAHWIRDQRHDR